MLNHAWWGAVAWTVVMGMASGCGGDSTASDAVTACEAAEQKLQSCGLLSPDSNQCLPEDDEGPGEDCLADCFQAAECSTLSDVLCSPPPEPSPRIIELAACFNDCWQQFGFQCSSGGGVALDFVCDGEDDCVDGSDEENCLPFACGDGQEVLGTDFCDGFLDCANGADEGTGCEQFTCADGARVPDSYRCDGESDCADGSDEAGCDAAMLQCNQ